MDQREHLTSLHELVESQRQLQLESFGGVDPADHDPEERARFITWNAYALEDEIHEVTGEVGWKPWATSRHLNRDAYLGEMADALHFFMNLCIVAGISGEELAQAYFRKRKVNVKRQEDGYDGVSGKDASGRATDEPRYVFDRVSHYGHVIALGQESHSQSPICSACNRDLTVDELQLLRVTGQTWTPMHGAGSDLAAERRAEEAAGRESVRHPAFRWVGGERQRWDVDTRRWVPQVCTMTTDPVTEQEIGRFK